MKLLIRSSWVGTHTFQPVSSFAGKASKAILLQFSPNSVFKIQFGTNLIMGPLRLNQDSLFPFVLQCSKLESIRNDDEKWSFFFSPEGIYIQSQEKNVFSCHCAKFDFWKNTHRTCHRDWMSLVISYKWMASCFYLPA